MSISSVIDEINNIRDLVLAYEALDSLQYEDAADAAFEALKSHLASYKSGLEADAKMAGESA